MRSLPFAGNIQPNTLLQRINVGEVSAAPAKQTPPGLVTVDQVADAVAAQDLLKPLGDLLRRFPWLPNVILVILILLLILLTATSGLLFAIGLVVVGVLAALYQVLQRAAINQAQIDAIHENNQTPESVNDLPRSPDFVISEPGAGVQPRPGASDSPEAVAFKTALTDLHLLLRASKEALKQEPKIRLDLLGITNTTVLGINPEVTIPRRTLSTIFLPDRLKAVLSEEFQEAMAYPEIDLPMYKPLSDISAELFLPNINLVEQNSITLLETNQKFIEAYMVGLNHEFARELLWREYPTDQRGSYFRQFWDVSSFFSPENLDNEQLKEKLRDIPPIHRWSNASNLGDHDHREQAGDKEEEVVLVIRGELLKKYPTAVVYAHRARWQLKPDGTIDNQQERRLLELTAAENATPPRDKVKTPLYQAKVEPDIYFFGFDLTVLIAIGGTGANPADDPGWFFVIKERPGEPRFGLDISRDGALNVWNDLAWADVLPNGSGEFIQITNAAPAFTLVKPTATDVQEKLPQYEEDKFVSWNRDASSAELAYVLYQVPVLVAVHAAEMLPPSHNAL